jgi:hypothetical protein
MSEGGSSDERLLPFCDVSGECLLLRQRVATSKKNYRPKMRLTRDVAEALEVPYVAGTLQRVLFFQAHPEYERD